MNLTLNKGHEVFTGKTMCAGMLSYAKHSCFLAISDFLYLLPFDKLQRNYAFFWTYIVHFTTTKNAIFLSNSNYTLDTYNFSFCNVDKYSSFFS